MGQLQKKLPKEKVNKKDSLKNQFEAEKQNKVEEASTRIVNFKVAVGCGCGGNYEWYHGEVPADSDIQDGDRFYDMPSEVNNIQSGRYKS